jgi:hypothetical protein
MLDRRPLFAPGRDYALGVARSTGEELLGRVRRAGVEPEAESSREALREALRSKEPRAIAKAAAIASAHDLVALRPELLAAAERLLRAPAKADPGCAAKAALVEALDRLGHDDVELFRRALRYVQWEPVFGGRVDTAVDLRGAGAMGLARLDPADLLLDLARLLADPQPGARIREAARGREEAEVVRALREALA